MPDDLAQPHDLPDLWNDRLHFLRPLSVVISLVHLRVDVPSGGVWGDRTASKSSLLEIEWDCGLVA